MDAMRNVMVTVLTALVSLPVQAGISENTVVYEQGGVKLEGFHAYDGGLEGKRPGVLIIHQWTGLTDNERMRARMLAELGYNAFAVDV